MDNVRKNIVSVRRLQLGADGLEKVYVEWDRVIHRAYMTINGRLIWEMTGEIAERFFNRYGLLIQDENGK